MNQDLDNELKKKELEIQNTWSEKNVKKYMIDSTKEAFDHIIDYNLESVNVDNYIGDENVSGMPLLGMLM